MTADRSITLTEEQREALYYVGGLSASVSRAIVKDGAEFQGLSGSEREAARNKLEDALWHLWNQVQPLERSR